METATVKERDNSFLRGVANNNAGNNATAPTDSTDPENPAEKLIITLVNKPRVKLDLLQVGSISPQKAGSSEPEGYFLLRKIRFHATNNIRASEIKLHRDAAELLTAMLRDTLHEIDYPRGTRKLAGE